MIFNRNIFIVAYMGVLTLQAAQIYNYDVPIVTIRAGNAWMINGNFKLVHMINLDEYNTIADNITTLIEKHMPPSQTKDVVNYHLMQIRIRLMELGCAKKRTKRSINWIGSAWKWVAGNPDAADWNAVLQSQNAIINNNNEQYKINEQLFNTTKEVVRKTNELIVRMNHINNGREAEQIGQDTMNQVLVLKDAINEIIRACQLAKSGIINTNLLDRNEVEDIITEMETLPYANAVEAIEYGSPSIYANGSYLLYVLSIPKLRENFYHRLIARATIRMGKQIELPFNEILISQGETYGVKNPCLHINNATVCQQSSLSQLAEETCIPRLLKGGAANCQYRKTKTQTIEVITTDILFLTNYEGIAEFRDHTEVLNGSYLIQLFNESVRIGNQTFSSVSTSKLQPLPSVLTNATSERLILDIEQVNDISLRNVNELQYLGSKLNMSLGSNTIIVAIAGICIGVLWFKMTRKLNLPLVEIPQSRGLTIEPARLICGTQTFKEGGVNSVADTADKTYLAESAY